MLASEEALANIPTLSTTTLEEVLEILRERTKATFSLMKKVDAELKNRGKEAKKELAKAKAKVRALAVKEAKLAKRTGLMTLTINFRNGQLHQRRLREGRHGGGERDDFQCLGSEGARGEEE